jgi:5,10-methylenetetrahydromethanopterin reductase
MTVEFWRFGYPPTPTRRIQELAREFEATGWDGLGVGESGTGRPDGFITLSLAAMATTTLRLGTATAIPMRHPMALASAMSVVNGLSNGRGVFGIARGDGVRLQLGYDGPLPFKEFERYFDELTTYLRGGTITLANGRQGQIRDLAVNDDSFAQAPPPLDLAVSGPRMIALGARMSDALSFSVGASVERLSSCIDQARSACDSIGRDPGSLGLGAYVQMAVADKPSEMADARDMIRGIIMVHAHFLAYHGKPAPGLSDDDASEVVKAAEIMNHLYDRPVGEPDPAGHVPPEALSDAFIDRYAIVGPADHCAERLQSLIKLGVERVWIGTRSGRTDVTETNAARIANEVLPLVRASLT